MAARSSAEFFELIPTRSLVLFLSGVFFVFAPVGPLFATMFEPERPWLVMLVHWTISGLLAVCWAATFTRSRWFIIGIVTLSAVSFLIYGPGDDAPFGGGGVQPSLAAIAVNGFIIVGYILFVVFISGQGKRTMQLQAEMELARGIHDSLVPAIAESRDGLEVYGVSRASSEMGGDLIDVIGHEDQTDVILADVSGHGVKAGVVMGMVKTALHTLLSDRLELGALLTRLNGLLERLTTPEMYATMAILRLPHGGEGLEYALAGHHHVLHYRAASAEMERLEGQNRPLGLFDQECSGSRTEIGPGDLLALYTDGLNEIENASGEELGHEPIQRAITEHASRPLSEIHEKVLVLVSAHGAQTDDQSLVLVRILG